MGEETPLEKLFKSMDKDGDGTVTKEVRRPLLSLIEDWGPLVEDFQGLGNLSL